MSKNPFYPSLKSHKVNIKKGFVFSSKITSDVRIIWDYHNKKANILDILDIGGYEGKDKVYN
ncbi:MAG: hypothetical protein ACOC1P_04805 [Minisyncoccales bacterium]